MLGGGARPAPSRARGPAATRGRDAARDPARGGRLRHHAARGARARRRRGVHLLLRRRRPAGRILARPRGPGREAHGDAGPHPGPALRPRDLRHRALLLFAIPINQLTRRSARKTDVRPILERISWFLRRSDDTRGDKFIESTLHFVMRHALACIKLRDAAFDLRDEYELLDRVVDRRVSRQLSQQFDDAITREAFRHDRILRFVAITGRVERRVAARVGPNVGPRIFRRCKLLAKQHFEGYAQLALGAGGRWFESSHTDQLSHR